MALRRPIGPLSTPAPLITPTHGPEDGDTAARALQPEERNAPVADTAVGEGTFLQRRRVPESAALPSLTPHRRATKEGVDHEDTIITIPGEPEIAGEIGATHLPAIPERLLVDPDHHQRKGKTATTGY